MYLYLKRDVLLSSIHIMYTCSNIHTMYILHARTMYFVVGMTSVDVKSSRIYRHRVNLVCAYVDRKLFVKSVSL